MQPEIKEISCPNCSSKQTKKHGTKKKKLQTLQRYFCSACKKTFTLQPDKNKTYTLKIILSALSYYNLGHSQSESAKEISKRFKVKPSQKTISNWLNEFKSICTFSKLRNKAIKLHNPESIIHKQALSHIQPYTFKYHKAKLHLLFHSKLYNNQFHNISHFYEPLKNYLQKISTKEFPHHIFTYNKDIPSDDSRPIAEIERNLVDNNLKNEKSLNNQSNIGKRQIEQRASQLKFEHLKIKYIKKQNQANILAKLAINLATTNKQRHEAIQNFFLINDSTTIAVEAPIYLTNWDAGYYRNQHGFIFPLSNYATPITGHIDILQIRNGLLHILDYKPDADKQIPIEQLTIYALALSRKLNLPLYHFKCAWFDEANYFEFFPLHAVYEKQGKGLNS